MGKYVIYKSGAGDECWHWRYLNEKGEITRSSEKGFTKDGAMLDAKNCSTREGGSVEFEHPEDDPAADAKKSTHTKPTKPPGS